MEEVKTLRYYQDPMPLGGFYREDQTGQVYRLSYPAEGTWDPYDGPLIPEEDFDPVQGYVVAEYIAEKRAG